MIRILALITLLALILALAGCGGNAPTPATESTPTPGPENSPADTGEKPIDPDPADTGEDPADPTPQPAKPTAQPGAAAALVRAQYPEMAQYPDSYTDDGSYSAWQKSLDAQRGQKKGYADGLEDYLRSSLTEFLSGAGESNRVCAPMNIYLCLAMLAEVTDGESRAQVLELLGEKNIRALRTRARALWNAEYRDDGLVTCRLASSLWLNENVGYNMDTLDTLGENYYASSFQGQMGSPEYDQLLRDWLNGETGDLLKSQSSGLKMYANTVLAMVTTIYFKAPWTNKFNVNATYPQTFHAPGGDEETDFLHKNSVDSYYWGEGFSAVSFRLETAGAMWFILPDEGRTPEDLLTGEAMDFLLSRNKSDWEKQKRLVVNFAAPRFDVSSDLDLIAGLKNLGLRDVFDMEASDFTPLTRDSDQIYVSRAQHAARVMIDEEGCTGAAYTAIMMAAGSAMPPKEEVDFTADRPFIFLVAGWDGLPLFAGIVNTTK